MTSNFLSKLNIFKRRQAASSCPEDFSSAFKAKYEHFKALLDSNAELSKIITDIEQKLLGDEIFGMAYIRSQTARATFHSLRMVQSLNYISGQRYPQLDIRLKELSAAIKDAVEHKKEDSTSELILPYSKIDRSLVNHVGGKNANLGEVRNAVGLPTPEGFAITTQAFEYFLNENDLVDEINKRKMEIDPNDPGTLNEASEDIQRIILSAPIPALLEKAILHAFDTMVRSIHVRTAGTAPLAVSLRSSAIGEDSELSYAGQYLSLLNVPRERLLQSYTYIIASLFTPRAISYRLAKGIRDEDAAMSVACLEMIDSVASGVAYSMHPFDPGRDCVLISAVWGLGPYAVDGVITPDSYMVAKDGTLNILEHEVSCKTVKLISNPEGGLKEVQVPDELQSTACLTEHQVRELAEYAIRLEQHYGCPQDIEWALDGQDRLIILQSRPLKVEGGSEQLPEKIKIDGSKYPLLIQESATACPGAGVGPAYLIHTDDDLASFPDGAILVARHSSPKFVVVMSKAQAIITDFGSVTGHMASLSREFRVPTLLDAKIATKVIQPGTEISVDAFSGKVYLGRVPELLNLKQAKPSHLEGTPIYRVLKRVADLIVPLRLTDPKSPKFTPENCSSFHDIMRFVHEASYKEMFQISDFVSCEGGVAVKLLAPIPLDLHVIDLGGGLSVSGMHTKQTNVNRVSSIPFKALLRGMLHEKLRYMGPRPVELRGFFSVMSQQMFNPTHAVEERFGDRSYAIVSDKYLNFSSRVGYHYSILDTYCGQSPNKNYIHFSFKGGAADDVRRNRRARAIAFILESIGFTVEVVGDRVDARYQKFEQALTEERLEEIGKLLLFTRQMDMLMKTEEAVKLIAESFLNGNYSLED